MNCPSWTLLFVYDFKYETCSSIWSTCGQTRNCIFIDGDQLWPQVICYSTLPIDIIFIIYLYFDLLGEIMIQTCLWFYNAPTCNFFLNFSGYRFLGENTNSTMPMAIRYYLILVSYLWSHIKINLEPWYQLRKSYWSVSCPLLDFNFLWCSNFIVLHSH